MRREREDYGVMLDSHLPATSAAVSAITFSSPFSPTTSSGELNTQVTYCACVKLPQHTRKFPLQSRGMARSSFAAVVAASLLLCVPLVGSEDLYWRPNTDWSNPSNWKLGRTPCEGDVADFSTVSSFVPISYDYIDY